MQAHLFSTSQTFAILRWAARSTRAGAARAPSSAGSARTFPIRRLATALFAQNSTGRNLSASLTPLSSHGIASLIQLRRGTEALRDNRLDRVHVRYSEDAGWLVVERGPWSIACNLSGSVQSIPLTADRPTQPLTRRAIQGSDAKRRHRARRGFRGDPRPRCPAQLGLEDRAELRLRGETGRRLLRQRRRWGTEDATSHRLLLIRQRGPVLHHWPIAIALRLG